MGQDLHIVPDLDLVLLLTDNTQGDPVDLEVVPSLDLLQSYVIPAVSDRVYQARTSGYAQQGHFVAISPAGSE